MAARNSIFACLAASFVYLSALIYDIQAADDKQSATYSSRPAAKSSTVTGIASYYGQDHKGRKTASGERFDPSDFTCASWHYPFGTILRVSYLNRHVDVRVNDRGPARRLHRAIDLSEASFSALADTKLGLIPVTIEKIP